jgi:hypothetical protein
MDKKNSRYNDENIKRVSMDDMISDEEQVLTEFLYASEPVTIRSVADRTDASIDKIGGIAMTLVNAGCLLSDSRSPRLNKQASLYPDPIVLNSIKEAKTFRTADSKQDIVESVVDYQKVISELEDETGFTSAEDFRDSVFDDDEPVELSDKNRQKSMKWTILEEQLETLKKVENKYEDLKDRNEFLQESFGFNPVSINPPNHDRKKHLEPVVTFPL